jgi:hypothetical protein
MNAKNAILVAITLVMVVAVTVLYVAPRPVAAAPLQYSGPARAGTVSCWDRDNSSSWTFDHNWGGYITPEYYSFNANDYPCGVVSYNGRTAAFDSGSRTVTHCLAGDSPAFSSSDINVAIVRSSSCSTTTAEVNISSWARTTTAGAPGPGYYTFIGAEGWGLIWQTDGGQTGPAYNVQYSTDCDGLYWTYSADFGFYC